MSEIEKNTSVTIIRIHVRNKLKEINIDSKIWDKTALWGKDIRGHTNSVQGLLVVLNLGIILGSAQRLIVSSEGQTS